MAREDAATIAARAARAKAVLRDARFKCGIPKPDPYLENREYNYVKWRGQKIPLYQTWKGKEIK